MRGVIFGRDFRRVRLKMIARRERERHGNRAQAERDRRIAGEAGIGIEDFVAGLEQRHHGEKERDLAAGRDHDVGRGDLDAAGAREVGGDFFAQRGNAGHGAVTVFAVGQRLGGRFDDRLAGMEVGLAEFQMNDGAALGFQFLGAGEDGERAFAAHD